MLNLMGAVEFCFMSFYALNASYPADCKVIWQFLQKYIFEVISDNDDFPSSNTVWSNLESVDINDKELHAPNEEFEDNDEESDKESSDEDESDEE